MPLTPTDATTAPIPDDSELFGASQKINAGLEQYHNWKQILSGALNDKQLGCGLATLLLFYVFYSVFNTAIGNEKDEDNTTCQCPLLHRWFYQAIVLGSGFIWIILFASITIYDSYKLYMNPRPRSTKSNHDDNDDGDKNSNHTSNSTGHSRTEGGSKSTDGNHTREIWPRETSENLYSKLDDKLKHCEKHLWLEFYKAYSVGSGTYESVSLPKIRSIIRENEEATNFRSVNNGNTSQSYDEPDSSIPKIQSCDEPDSSIPKIESIETIAKGSYFFFYPFLVTVRLLAQMSLVPILILQMLDTYAWICFTEDYHCQNALTRYQLGLYQAYMTFGFYIALLIAILATTMLRWFPYSKHARNIGAASCI